jgi:aconitate decarboxylase
MSSVTSELVTFIVDVKLCDVPPSVVERAKSLTLDGIACALVSAHLSWSETGTNTVLDFEGSGPCSVWGWDKVPLSSSS